MTRLLLPLLLFAVAVSPARAALDPERDRPYQVRVVLHVASNRFLTPLFQDQVQRELGDHLRLTFGPLAAVEVVRTHPLLRDIEARGLEPALDGYEATSDRTTFFLLLHHEAGEYHLQARQHCGMTGRAMPLVRRARTGERALVAQAAARLIEQDFAPVGTVTDAKAEQATVALKAGGLGPLARWVQPGHVFAVYQVIGEGERQRTREIPWALLEVVDVSAQDGTCRCRYWRRYEEDRLTGTPGVLGYRCVKLPTTVAPVRLRLVDDDTGQPLDGVQLHVSRPGATDKKELTVRDGLAVTAETFPHMALVKVITGGTPLRLPVALVGSRPVVCRVKVQPGADAAASLQYRRDVWVQRIFENLRLSTERASALNGVLNDSLSAALEMSRAGQKYLDAELSHLATERDELVRLAKEHKLPAGKPDLREGDQQVAELQRKQKELHAFVGRLEDAAKDGAAETGLTKLLERARLMEEQADYDPALALYDQALKIRADLSKVRDHAESLRKAWAIKGDRHAGARAFVYKTWPTLDLAGLKANLDKAKDALAACREADDRLTPRKLLQAGINHVAKLKRDIDALDRRDTEDNRNQAKAVRQVAEGLSELIRQTSTYLSARKE